MSTGQTSALRSELSSVLGRPQRSLSQHREWLLIRTGHKYCTLRGSTLSVCVQFSWLSSYMASSETCSTKHCSTWRQLQPLWCRVELCKRWKLSRGKRPVICGYITAVAAATFFIWFSRLRRDSCSREYVAQEILQVSPQYLQQPEKLQLSRKPWDINNQNQMAYKMWQRYCFHRCFCASDSHWLC